jgi:hypothetical protein
VPPRTKEQAERALGAYQRPSINFTQRDDVRDFARSAHGQNYNRMMDLQQQLPTMTRNDPRVQEFKDRRRTFNRYGKYPMGEMLGYTPQQMQDQYVDLSRDVRQTNKPVYNKMYPLTGMAMDYPQKGGLLGMIAKDMFGKVSDFGKSMVNKEGIVGAADADEAEMDDYAAQTFGMGAPMDRHPGSTPVIEGPMEQSEVIYSPHGPTYYDRAEGLDFEDDPNQPYVAPDDYVEDDFGAFYTDENTLAPERGLPFDDSAREDFIRRQNEVIPAEPLPIGSPDPQGDFDSFNEYVDNESGLEVTLPLPFDDVIPPIPFDDTGRETGIASLYGQGPSWAETDRRYEDEYRDYTERMGDMVGGPMTYEEFARAYERIHQGKPHAGLR